MNENKPNWADKANLASNVLRNIQLQEVHSTMRALGDLQAQRIQLELSEQHVREREDRLRDHIWQMEHAFESVLRDASLTPCTVHVLAQQVLDGMALYRVTTASFRQFNDKDRLGQFTGRLQQAIEDTAQKMSPEQCGDTEKFLCYQSESQELAGLIEDLQAKRQENSEKVEKTKKRKETAIEELEVLRPKVGTPEAKTERLAAVAGSSAAKVGAGLLVVFAGAGWLSLVLFFGIPLYGFFTDGNTAGDGELFATGVVVLLVAAVLTAASVALGKKTQPPKSLEEQIALREREIRDADTLTAKLSQVVPSSDGLRKFGAKDLTELIQQQTERRAFMLQFSQANHLPLEDPYPREFQEQSSGAGPASLPEMSPEVQELARRADKKIFAIKLYREQTGAGLAEAKEAVEAFFERIHSDNR